MSNISGKRNAVSGAGIQRIGTKKTMNPRIERQIPETNIIKKGVNVNERINGCPKKVIKDEEEGENKITQKERQKLITIAQEEEEKLPTLIIESVMISIYDYEELKREAVVKVTIAEDTGYNSVNDPRMGVANYGEYCNTCNKDTIDCPGHLGYIEFNAPIYHPLFVKTIIKVLTCVCNSCGGLLLPKEQIEKLGIMNYTGLTRLNLLENASMGLECRAKHGKEVKKCMINPIYLSGRYKDTHKIMFKYEKGKGKKEEHEKPIEEVEKILNAITAEEAEIMGFKNGSHPSKMILKALPVIPPVNRPAVITDGVIYPDQLTSYYKDIVTKNNQVGAAKTEKDRDIAINALIYAIEHYIDNTDKKYSQGNKREFSGIKQRIQGKEAIIRSLLMGKRVNYSGRTVLSPDPSLKFGQLRVPERMAEVLTVKVIVNNINKNALQELLRKGKITDIKPIYGKFKGNKIKVTQDIINVYQLNVGDEVHRHLQNGDYVIFNRQPTLHKQGMMGHEVVIGKQLTFGVHLSYTTPYNADFDGDEGNLHVPQTLDAMAEVMGIMNVKNCIMNGQTNRPTMGIVYDGLTGAYLMTQDLPITVEDENGKIITKYINKTVPEDLFNDCLLLLTNQSSLPTLNERLDKLNIPRYSGKALFSSLLPEDFYYTKGNVIIINGILTNGTITKDHIGIAHGSIIQALWKDYGRDRTVDFLTDAPFIINRWLQETGFSVGLKDCYPKDDSHKELLRKEQTKAKLAVESLGPRIDDPLEEELRERQVIGYVNIARDVGNKISIDKLTPDNALNVMALSGAKGSTLNIAQITGILGQQVVKNQRMPLSISEGQRCLPYFEKGELDPKARGFCTNSFLSGLNPDELFFHQAGGREGLTDTGVKTAETGSMHHTIVKALEDMTIWYDGSVRNGIGTIFEFVYGDDGFSASELEKVKTNTGELISFIDLDRTVGRINAKHGFYNISSSNKDKPVSIGPEEREIMNEFSVEEEEDNDTFDD